MLLELTCAWGDDNDKVGSYTFYAVCLHVSPSVTTAAAAHQVPISCQLCSGTLPSLSLQQGANDLSLVVGSVRLP